MRVLHKQVITAKRIRYRLIQMHQNMYIVPNTVLRQYRFQMPIAVKTDGEFILSISRICVNFVLFVSFSPSVTHK